jgi:GST-like protein
MLDFYFWTTPNGYKIAIALAEMALPHRVIPVNIGKGEQFKPEFLAISPNNRMPALVDHDPKGGGAPISVFESGAILLYLAEKTGQFIPADVRGRVEVTQWLFWQMAGLGPMAGQNGHFNVYAPEKIPYAIERYTKETNRLYGVLNKRLADREFIAGAYSIADMASYPWIRPWKQHGQNLDDFRHLKRWFETVGARPAVKRAYESADTAYNTSQPITEEARKILFGQTARPE